MQAKVLRHFRIECFRKVLQRQLAREHLPLELEAKDDVQAVRHLVRVYASERGMHLVERVVERLELHVTELLRELLLQLRIEEPPRRDISADQVLPHAAL